MQNEPLFPLSYFDQLGAELREVLAPSAMLTAARGDYGVQLSEPGHTLSIRPSLSGQTVELVHLRNGCAGLGTPAADLRNLPAVVVAGIVAGWVEAN